MVEHPNVGGDRSGRGKNRSGIAAILMVALGLSACGKESSQAAPASDGKEAPVASVEASQRTGHTATALRQHAQYLAWVAGMRDQLVGALIDFLIQWSTGECVGLWCWLLR